ncbi:MAG: polysaccharide biosynthesis tyrosine autokinase [Undibacterium sp.]|nr:polysaccharide biosynthesis tyrosine autokinase [Opitutaceae bacterium]
MTTTENTTPRSPSAAKSSTPTLRRTPRDFWDMFAERWWIGAIIGLIAAGLIVWFRPHFEQIYTTEVSLLFEARKDRVLNIQEVVDTSLQTATELNTHMEQLRSKTFADYVLASFSPAETEVVQKAYIDPLRPSAPLPSLASIIRPNVTVFARRGTPIIGIQAANRSPDAAALIANRYARKYIDYNLDSANTRTNSAIVFLRNQAEETRTQVEAAENALQTYRAKHNLAAIGETQNVVLQKMSSLGTAVVRATLDQIDAKSLIDKIGEYLRGGRNLLEIPQILSAGQVSSLNSSLNQLLSQRTMLAERYGAQHPKIKQNEIEAQETRRMLKESIDKAIADLNARYEVSAQYLQRLQAETVGSEGQARELDKISVDYKFLEQDANAKRATYTRIMDRLTEATITSQMANTNIAIFDPAWIPDAPSDTGAMQITVKAGTSGLALLILIPLAIGLMDSRIRTPAQVEDSLQEPLLGVVKKMRKMGEAERAQVFRLQKNQDLAEAYRGIFSEIEVRSPLGFPKAFLVTSSVPAEGKSLLCSNLAAVFAAHKRRTLLVDCDLRRPTLHRYFGIKASTGWVDWLETPPDQRPASPDGIVHVSDHLDLLPAGRNSERPTELLDHLGRRETLQILFQNYDIVIFDTPPAAIFPDALMLARCCHEMIYVCRYRTVRAVVIRKVLDRFRGAGISVLGVVLNQLPESKARTYGYHGYGTQSADYYKAYVEQPKA